MDLETVINSFHADINKLCFEKLLPYFSTKSNKNQDEQHWYMLIQMCAMQRAKEESVSKESTEHVPLEVNFNERIERDAGKRG